MKIISILFICLAFLTACGTTDKSLVQSGHSQDYIIGFHDGRHSGMQQEGIHFETYIKDADRFENNADYKQGWLDGEAEGRKLSVEAKKVGEAVGDSYSTIRISHEAIKARDAEGIGKDVLKGIDTQELKSLEK
jgi:hypothetical protein